MMRAWLAAVVLLAAACKSRPPALALECVTHQDCGMTQLGADCCDVCEPRLGNRTSLDAFDAHCRAHPGKTCPELKCAGSVFTAMCDNGHCVARPGVH